MAHSFLKSEIKLNLLTVIIESENADNSMSSLKNRKCGHMKMQVISDIKGDILKSAVKKDVSKPERQTVHGCNAPKVFKWVHIAISNVKSLFMDMYHGIKEEFFQEYLNDFCYKFNRK